MSISGVSPAASMPATQDVAPKTQSAPAAKPAAPAPSAGADSDGDHDGSGGFSVKA